MKRISSNNLIREFNAMHKQISKYQEKGMEWKEPKPYSWSDIYTQVKNITLTWFRNPDKMN